MVVAAPDHDTGPGGDYYYAWQRDGALSMNAFLQTTPKLEDVEEKMMHWISWVERSTKQSDAQGDIFVEPKYLIPSGKPFPGGWCRPQNDGPGLRAITLMNYAAVKADVADRAWNSVKEELDWVAANYTSEGCDLWEEVKSSDFFWNRYTMRKALIMGADFASVVGKDLSRSSNYKAKAAEITAQLSSHVEEDGFVFESVNRKIDTAVIEAFNVGDLDDGVFAPLSKEVIATLVGLSRTFCKAYDVNQQQAVAKKQGVLFGRYEGDTYDGGNPWVLLSASASTLLYRQSLAMSKGATVPSGTDLETLLGQDVTASNLLGAGDAILNFMKTYLTNGMHMNEQIDRNTGALLSAKDLTWNYANVLKAMKARDAAIHALTSSTSAIVV
jgi:glucoamylase